VTTGELTGGEDNYASSLTRTIPRTHKLLTFLGPGRLAHSLAREIAAFALVGSLGILVDSAIFNALFSHGQVVAKTMSTTCAMVFTYWGNRTWSFAHRSRSPVPGRAGRFVIINLIALGFSVALVALCEYPLHMKGLPLQMNMANLTTIALGTVFRFWAYRRYVFPCPATDPNFA
jgi:putative flippase GtrA